MFKRSRHSHPKPDNVVARYIEARNHGDTETIREVVSLAARFDEPDGTTKKGIYGQLALMDAHPGAQWYVDELLCDGTRIVAQWSRHESTAPPPDIISGVTIFDISRGQIVSAQTYENNPTTAPPATARG